MNKIHFLLASGLMVFSSLSFAHDEKTDDCQHALEMPDRGKLRINPSGHPDDDSVIPQFSEDITHINEVAKKLGYVVPPHEVNLLSAGDLGMLAILGRYAIPHYIDGSNLVTQAGSRASVLEFVWGGCPTCRSYNATTTKYLHQLEVFAHVLGHNDMSSLNIYDTQRSSDVMASSYRLANFVSELYKQYDHDEVSRWIRWMMSLNHLQDFAYGSYDHPDKFKNLHESAPHNQHIHDEMIPPRVIHASKEQRQGKEPPSKRPEKRKLPTKSVFAAMVHNLPKGTPAWKIELLRLFEESVRLTPSVIQTKIMNEGWATFSEYFIMAHSKFTSTEALIEFANLNTGVAVPMLGNPYWVGLEGWHNLYNKFIDREDIRDLPTWEKSQAFVKYAHEIMSWANDYDFLKLALDADWIKKHDLYLSRKATPEEMGGSPPPFGTDRHVVISRDASRIIEWLASQIGDKAANFPQIQIRNFSAFGRGVVALEQVDYKRFPLKKESAAQTLYVISQMYKRPVSIDMIAPSIWADPPRELEPWEVYYMQAYGWIPEDYEPSPQITFQKVRLEVAPDGTCTTHDLGDFDEDGNFVERPGEGMKGPTGDDRFSALPKLNAEFQEAVDRYRFDLEGMENHGFTKEEVEYLNPYLQMAVDHQLKGVAPSLSHVSSASEAILEYSALLKKRMLLAIRRLIQGNAQTHQTGNSVRIKVLPDVPQFEYDREVIEQIQGDWPPAPFDPAMPMSRQETDTQTSLQSSSSQFVPSPSAITMGKTKKPPVGKLEVLPEVLEAIEQMPDSREKDRFLEEVRLAEKAQILREVESARPKVNRGRGVFQRMRTLSEPHDHVFINSSRIPIFGATEDDGSGIGAGDGMLPGDQFDRPRGGAGGQGPGEGDEAGQGEGDPSWIELPMDLYAKILIGELELPNMKSKHGQSDQVESIRVASVRRPSGYLREAETVDNVVEMAKVDRKRRGLPTSGVPYSVLLREGLKYYTPDMHVVADRHDVPMPEVRAVMVWVIDLTGSMGGPPLENARELTANMSMILNETYKQFDERFIGFDFAAHEYPKDQIFKAFLGGGTKYLVGIEKAEQILSEYDDTWDKYVGVIGDMGDFYPEESIEALERIYPNVNHIGVFYTPNHESDVVPDPRLAQQSRAMMERKRWVGFTKVPYHREGVLKSMQEVYGKGVYDQKSASE